MAAPCRSPRNFRAIEQRDRLRHLSSPRPPGHFRQGLGFGFAPLAFKVGFQVDQAQHGRHVTAPFGRLNRALDDPTKNHEFCASFHCSFSGAKKSICRRFCSGCLNFGKKQPEGCVPVSTCRPQQRGAHHKVMGVPPVMYRALHRWTHPAFLAPGEHRCGAVRGGMRVVVRLMSR
jgi:hypothetical protein